MWQCSLGWDTNSKATHKKTDKQDFIEMKTFCALERHHQQSRKATHGMEETVCKSYTDEGLIFRIRQNYDTTAKTKKQNKTKNPTKTIQDGQRTRMATSLRKTDTCSTSTRQEAHTRVMRGMLIKARIRFYFTPIMMASI